VEFIDSENLHAFFWRLRSFEDHVFRGNRFRLDGMMNDLQGMAVVVEHVARALGGTKTQLYERFKELWRDPDVIKLLKDNEVTSLARNDKRLQDWPALKCAINNLRSQGPAGAIAADLAMAHRIRGGVHKPLPETDGFELEKLFVGLMRATVMTFANVRR
jgi:hypothetical protein